MLIKRLKVSGILSFGPEGIDLELRDLNVLIGPNGSGKSNLLEVLATLQAMPTSFGRRLVRAGSLEDFFWKGSPPTNRARIETQLGPSDVVTIARHIINFEPYSNSINISRESLHEETYDEGSPIQIPEFLLESGRYVIANTSGESESGSASSLEAGESLLSQIKYPGKFPVLRALQASYEAIRVYRSWTFGPNAAIRQPQRTDLRADYLSESGDNLAIILSNRNGQSKREFTENLKELIPGLDSFSTPVVNGTIQLLLDEGEGKQIPASRLSDGTLRYMCLLTILLDPNPPPLVAIDEPELGLHPDMLPVLGRLIKQASTRTQLIVTTHSQVLLDCFSETPEDVVVCSRGPQGSVFERLNAQKLAHWLEEHTLGELWDIGEIGGNRW